MEIKIIDDLFDEEIARQIIKENCEDDNEGNKEILSDSIDPESALGRVLRTVQPEFDKYGETSKLQRVPFYTKVIAIKNDNGDGADHPLHIDQSVAEDPNGVSVAAFVSLLYLNGSGQDYEGGQLYFPFQNKLIEPKVGRMLLFPSGQLFPHKIFPFFGKPRYLLRIFHLIDSKLEGKDKTSYIKRAQISQEKKEL